MSEHGGGWEHRPGLWADGPGRGRPRRAWRRRPVVRLLGLAAGAALVVAGVAAVLARLDGSPGPTGVLDVERGDEAGGPATPTRPPPAGGRWAALPPAPVSWRQPPSVVWTGTEMVALGSGPEGLVGAAYDPGGRRWRRLADAPLSARSGFVAVWAAGDEAGHGEVIVWGGRAGHGRAALDDGAAYDPVQDRWRTLASAPLSRRSLAVGAWTGAEMIVAGGFAEDGHVRAGTAAYDPTADRWRALPDLPVTAPVRSLVWTGRQAIAVSGAPRAGADGAVLGYRAGADAWQELPDAPGVGDGRGLAVVTGDGRVFAWHGGDRQPARLLILDPRRRWRPAAAAPVGAGQRPAIAWTGQQVVVWGGASRAGRADGGAVYDPQADRWFLLPSGPLRPRTLASAVWTGREVIVFGGVDLDSVLGDGAAWRPTGAVPP